MSVLLARKRLPPLHSNYSGILLSMQKREKRYIHLFVYLSNSKLSGDHDGNQAEKRRSILYGISQLRAYRLERL